MHEIIPVETAAKRPATKYWKENRGGPRLILACAEIACGHTVQEETRVI